MQVKPSHHGSKWVNYHCADMVSALELYSGQSYDNQYLLTPLFTPDFGFYENLGIDTLVNHPQAMKVYMTHSPDTP